MNTNVLRQFLVVVLAVGVSLGAVPTGAVGVADGSPAALTTTQATEFGIEYDPTSAGSGGENTDSPPTYVYEESFNVRTVDETTFRLGADSEYRIRVVAPESGRSVLLVPNTTETVTVTGFSFDLGSARQVSELPLNYEGPDGADDSVPVTVEGNASALTDDVIASYRVEVVDGSGNVVAATGEAEHAVGYRAEFVYNGTHFGVTRNPEVTTEYYAFVDNRSRGGFQPVAFDADDEWFVFRADSVGVDPNTSFEIEIYTTPGENFEDRVANLFYLGSFELREVSGPIENVSASGGSDGGTNDTVSVSPPALSAPDRVGPVDSGETVDVTFEYTNDGSEPVEAGRLEFYTPPGLIPTSLSGDGTAGLNGRPPSVLYGLAGPVEPGETRTTTVTFEVSGAVEADELTFETAAYRENADDPTTATTTVEVGTSVVARFDGDGSGSISPGEAQDAIVSLNRGDITPQEAQRIIVALNSG